MVITSTVLAALALYRPFRALLWMAAGFCAVAAAADLHEVRIQIDGSKTSLAIIATSGAIVHLIGAVAGTIAARERA